VIRKSLLPLVGVVISLSLGCGDGRNLGQSQTAAPLRSQSSFAVGIAHVAGNYGFTQENFLVEGAERIQALGSDAIFIYLTPSFRQKYPERASNSWPATDPHNLVELAQTDPYRYVLGMPFKTIVLTANTFANSGSVAGFASTPSRWDAEEQEYYRLAKYLYQTYQGSGKTFILKNWEGDWLGLQNYDTTADISPGMIDDLRAWLSAREHGVNRARQELGRIPGVAVFHAVEVNRVLDCSQRGLQRLINAVVPYVNADMVTYSSYDSTLAGSDANAVAQSLNEALDTIKRLAPDPLGLGDRRILITEYGLYEMKRPSETIWRAEAILSTAKSAGLVGAFLWNVFDNECTDANGQPDGVGILPGDAGRPDAAACPGLWAVRPDGSISPVVSVLQKYWHASN
jgi:hypothetical protein